MFGRQDMMHVYPKLNIAKITTHKLQNCNESQTVVCCQSYHLEIRFELNIAIVTSHRALKVPIVVHKC